MVPVFEIKNLGKSYNGKSVVSIGHCAFEQGRIYCLYGTNGSGKTTLFELLTLLQKPTGGEIFYKGECVYPGDAGTRRLRSEVTLVHQNPLVFDTTVEKNIDYGLRVRKVPKHKRLQRVRECLEVVGLSGFEHRKARGLSGGETQRIAIARALAIEPAVILLDEFSANVDSDNRKTLEDIIKRINRDGATTVLFTTHYLDQAYRLAHDVVHLHKGRVVEPHIRNIFHGVMRQTPAGTVFENAALRIFMATPYAGPATIAVPADSIIISKHTLDSSMRNCLNGKVKHIVDNGKTVLVRVQAGAIFEVMITKESYYHMGLGPGLEIYLYFKSSSVKLM